MEKISKKTLLKSGFSLDDIYCIEVNSGNIYFAGWTESAEHYNTVFARNRYGIELKIEDIKEKGLESAILESYAWDTPMSTTTEEHEKPVEALMQQFNEYENIFVLGKQDAGTFLESAKDGIYILIIRCEM